MPSVTKIALQVLASVLPVALTASSAAAQTCATPPYSATKTGRTAVIEVDWEKLVACKGADGRISLRIDEDIAVDVKVTNFNFVAYTTSYQVEETVVESYVMLEKLWAQLLGLPIFPGATLKPTVARLPEALLVCGSFDACLANWALLIATTNIELDKARQQHAQLVALNATQRGQVASSNTALITAGDNITGAMQQLLKNHQPQNLTHVTQFETVYGRQQTLFDKIAAYTSAAMRVQNGEVRHLGKKKAGTIVAVGITPKDHTQAAQTPVADIDYFVHSRIPLTFHVGYAYTSLKSVTFEPVRSLSQADLFALVKENENTSTMLAMLGLGRTFVEDTFGVYASIGTDFAEPGDRLYVGGSVQLFKRLFLTAGVLSATEEVGEQPVLDRIGGTLEARELFAAIRTHRNWKSGFGAITFRVF